MASGPSPDGYPGDLLTHRRAISLTRREALLAGMGSAALGLVPPQLWGAAAEIAATDLGDDLVLYSGAGGNVVGLKSVEGLLLVDSGRAEHSKALLAKVQERQGKGPVRYLLNTHWHLDHTGDPTTRSAAPGRRSWHTRTPGSGWASRSSASGKAAPIRRDRRRRGPPIRSSTTRSGSRSAVPRSNTVICRRRTPTATFMSTSRGRTCSLRAT